MRMVVDLDMSYFMKALKHEDVEESVKFFLDREYSNKITMDEFLDIMECKGCVEVMDTTEYDVDKDFAKLLDKYDIPYSKFIIIDEDNEKDDMRSIDDAIDIFGNEFDIYSEYQGTWVF